MTENYNVVARAVAKLAVLRRHGIFYVFTVIAFAVCVTPMEAQRSQRVWTPLAKPSNADVRHLACDSSGFWYCSEGYPLSQGFRSTDNGVSWSALTVGGIFVCDGTFVGCAYNGRFYRSEDNGGTWSQSIPIDSPSVSATCLCVTKSHVIYLGSSERGVFRSTDYGLSWSSCPIGKMDVTVRDIQFGTAGDLFLATDQGVFVSNDNGDSWMLLAPPGQEGASSSIISIDERTMVVGTDGDFLFHTSDQGGSWTESVDLAHSGARHIQDLLLDRSGLLFCASLDGGVMVSSDSGKSWDEVNYGIEVPYNLFALMATVDYGIVVGGSDGRLYSLGEKSKVGWEGSVAANCSGTVGFQFGSEIVRVPTQSVGIWSGSVEMFDVSGRRIFARNYDMMDTGNPIVIDVQHMLSGYYFCRVKAAMSNVVIWHSVCIVK